MALPSVMKVDWVAAELIEFFSARGSDRINNYPENSARSYSILRSHGETELILEQRVDIVREKRQRFDAHKNTTI